MNIRIRYIARRRKGLVVQNEIVTSKQSLVIGRATDQDVFLSDLGVAYRHARLTLSSNGQVGITSLSTAGIYINGRFLQSGSFKKQGVFQIGPYSIEVISSDNGFDFDITVEKIAEDIVEQQSELSPAITLEETWLSRRRGSWVGFLLIVIIFLVFPLAGYFDKDIAKQQRASTLLPDDGLWQSGEISKPHKHFSDNCDNCHLNAFEKVADKACITCHASTTVHADPEMFDLHALQNVRCASCHKEHNGADYLIRSDQYLCSDCHKNLRAQIDTELENISDFTVQHSEFRPLLFTRDVKTWNQKAASDSTWQRVSLKHSNVKHETGIKFPHDVHLDVNGLDSPAGNKVLQCVNCHQTDVSGRYMLPINFENDCQQCHRLTFDPNTPERELPHSNLDALSSTLNEYYAYVALRGDYQDEDVPVPSIISQRRIPGKELTPFQRKTALAWALEKAEDVKEEVIEFRTCGLCHRLERDEKNVSGWVIPSVKISQRWLTKGAFDHETHRTTSCADCHQADQSNTSEDVLLPAISVCRDCHGGENAEHKLETDCVECHVFHTPDSLLLGKRQ